MRRFVPPHAVLALLGATAALEAAETAPTIPTRAAEGTVSVVSVEAIDDPLQYDVRARQDELQPGRCDLGDGTSVEIYFTPDTPRVDATLILRKDGEERKAVRPEPRTPLRGAVGGGGYTLACDPTARRFYYGHPLLGYVVAYDAEGTELWRHELEGFAPMALTAETTVAEFFAQLVGDRSLLMAVVCRDGIVVVEERNTAAGTVHTWLDRGGTVLARVGPWDGFLYEPGGTDADWGFLVGGGVDPGSQVPRQFVKIRVGEV